MSTLAPNADMIAGFVNSVMSEAIPDATLEGVRFAITDWFGVAIGAGREVPVAAIKQTVSSWNSRGRAQILLGGAAAPAPVALVNGTMAHCLDFDDTHVGSIAHLSGPVWAAAFAVGSDIGAAPERVVRAFLAGFEVGARLGCGGFGVAVNERRIHSTGVFGCLGAAVAAGALLGLDAERLKMALGLAATQVAGLTESFGTPAKPFHAGKAAFNGVLAAELARDGYAGAVDLLEPDGGLALALVQDRSQKPLALDFSDGWEITRNTLKPYASCLLTHPIIDSCRELHERLGERAAAPQAVRIRVNPLSIQIAGKPEARTPFEGKFSLAFCTALALTGRRVSQGDFSAENVNDARLKDLVSRVTLVPTPEMDLRAGEVELEFADSEIIQSRTALALGNPDRPMSWDDMRTKFVSLVGPLLGDAGAEELYQRVRKVDAESSLEALMLAVSAGAVGEEPVRAAG